MPKWWSREGMFFLPLVPLAVLIAVTVASYFEGYLDEGQARIVISALGVLATVSLVSATITSIQQNRKTIEDLERDRQKPIYTNIVRQIVQPTRGNISTRERAIKEGKILRSSLGDQPFAAISPASINPVLWERFDTEYPVTANQISEIDITISETRDLANEIVDEVKDTIGEELDDTEVDEEMIAKKLVSPGWQISGDPNTEEIWDEKRDDLQEVVYNVHLDEFHELRLREYRLFIDMKELLNQLVNIESDLRTEYGIPVEGSGDSNGVFSTL